MEKLTLSMQMVGQMLMSCMHRSCPMSNCCNDLLKHPRPQMPHMPNLQQRNREKIWANIGTTP